MRVRYLYIAPWRVWRDMVRFNYPWKRSGIFRNLPHIKPGRWGFYFFGLEIGSRNPQDKIGVWLKEKGLYPW